VQQVLDRAERHAELNGHRLVGPVLEIEEPHGFLLVVRQGLDQAQEVVALRVLRRAEAMLAAACWASVESGSSNETVGRRRRSSIRQVLRVMA